MRIFNKCAAAVLAVLCLSLAGCGVQGQLTVVFPEIGSADASLLMTEDATVLIDTGETNDADTILALLEESQRDTIDLLIISHYDKDHVGGAAEILEQCTVKRVISSTSPKDSDEMAAYLAALSAAGLTEEIPKAPMTISLSGMELSILPPEQDVYTEEQSNNSSLVVTVSFGATNLLFAGDAMAERVAEFAPELESGTFELIKLPHHGRDADTTRQLLPALSSGAAAVLTSSKKEPEADAVLDCLEEAGIQAYLTRKGTVTAVSDGKTLKISQDS